MAGALEKLGAVDEIYAPMVAIVPRVGSILDVATLAGLGGEDGEPITVSTSSGLTLTLRRQALAALTAELRIELAELPREFFRTTDLLDFPGARSRQKVDLSAFFEMNAEALKETFLRGKVSYLFERYVAEQELTSMLLCVRPSNQEVATLPDLVDDWIAATHGRTAKSRTGQPTLLFVVLTWFDSHFVDKAGDSGNAPGARFSARTRCLAPRLFREGACVAAQLDRCRAFPELLLVPEPELSRGIDHPLRRAQGTGFHS